MSQNRATSILDLALESMRAANLLTPAIVGVFQIVKSGREAGKDDEAVKRESVEYVDNVVAKADAQLAIKPDQN